MTELKFDDYIYNDLINDNNFINETEALLNALIDDELEKDNPDFDFIDDCIETIDLIRNGVNFTDEVLSKKDFINKIVRKKRYPALIATISAAAAFALVFGYMQTGHNEEIITKISELTRSIPFLNSVEPVAERSVVSIKCAFEDGFKDEYIRGENFNSSGITVIAEYSDGTKEVVAIDEYTITVGNDFGKSVGYETVTVEYMGVSTEFKVRILFDENSVILNSIYAGFPDDVTVSKDNLDKILVYAVYSDGSERKLETEEYRITVESADEIMDIVTIDYKNCSATFAIEKEDSK